MTKRVSLFTLLSLAIVLILVAGNTERAANAQSRASASEVLAGSHGSGAESACLTVSSHTELEEGKRIFRYDTFGDEAFWGDTLRLHEAIAGSANGGVGPGVSPRTALAVGLKVDSDALPLAIVQGIQSGAISLDDPATTLVLLQLDSVVGVTGRFSPRATRSSRSGSSARSVTPPSVSSHARRAASTTTAASRLFQPS
jgi:hypothetical protein